MLFIKPALTRMAHVALATCPTHACHDRCDANFFIKRLQLCIPFKVNHIQLELLPGGSESDGRYPLDLFPKHRRAAIRAIA